MACLLPPSERDLLVRLFRAKVYAHAQFVEFPHQAEWRLATEGLTLTSRVVDPLPDDLALTIGRDYTLTDTPVPLLVPADPKDKQAFMVGETGNYAKVQWQLAVPREGGIAHTASDLAAFKAGKSKGVGMWAAGFACLPGATIDMVGMEYANSEHEYDYLCQALLSGSKPIVQKSQVQHYYNDVRGGRMYLELRNGCSFGVRSYKNKDSLRGGQITCYIFNEVYMLPGLQVLTGHAQNLRAERGYNLLTTTPDRPWVKVLHTMGHGAHPDWHCTCGSTGHVNPLTFSLPAFMLDVPDWETIAEKAPELLELCLNSGLQPGGLMSQEKFLISWLGQLGGFVGSVYAFNKQRDTFTPDNAPGLFKPSVVKSWQDRSAYLSKLRTDAVAG